MRVIGSERAIDFTVLGEGNNFLNTLSDKGYLYTYSSGRNAIFNLMKQLREKRILFPDFFCPSMLIPVKMAKKTIVFYRINRHFKAIKSDLEKKIKACDIVFITDYFGQRDTYTVELASYYNKTLIIDRTHSLLGNFPQHGDYEIASLRKLFPVPDGGIIISNGRKLRTSSKQRHTETFAAHKAYAKMLRYIDEYVEHSPLIEQYYVQYSQSSEQSMQLGNYDISPISRYIVDHYPVESAAWNRKRNAEYLISHMNNSIEIPIDVMHTPQSIPVYVNKRSAIKEYLHGLNIYIPVLWRNSKSFSRNLLNIPVDDEYSIDDMKRLIKGINSAVRDIL